MAKKLVDTETGKAVTVIGPETPSRTVLVQHTDGGALDVIPVDQLQITDD